MSGKGVKANHCWMFCLYTSSKISRIWFEFSLKVKRWNPGYLLKSRTPEGPQTDNNKILSYLCCIFCSSFFLTSSQPPHSPRLQSLPQTLVQGCPQLLGLAQGLRRGIYGYFFLSLSFSRSQVVMKCHQMAPFFVHKEVLGEKVIIWVKYGNAFTKTMMFLL